MGVVEQTLADFDLSTGQHWYIETNASGTIHLHMGTVRLDMTPAEFEHFAAVVSAAGTELASKKGHDTDEPRTRRA